MGDGVQGCGEQSQGTGYGMVLFGSIWEEVGGNDSLDQNGELCPRSNLFSPVLTAPSCGAAGRHGPELGARADTMQRATAVQRLTRCHICHVAKHLSLERSARRSGRCHHKCMYNNPNGFGDPVGHAPARCFL